MDSNSFNNLRILYSAILFQNQCQYMTKKTKHLRPKHTFQQASYLAYFEFSLQPDLFYQKLYMVSEELVHDLASLMRSHSCIPTLTDKDK